MNEKKECLNVFYEVADLLDNLNERLEKLEIKNKPEYDVQENHILIMDLIENMIKLENRVKELEKNDLKLRLKDEKCE